jgi:PmbA protein
LNESRELARLVIRMALDGGATAAECTISEGDQFSVSVRKGQIETLTEAGSRGIGLRVLAGSCVGSAYSSDLTDEGLRAMVESALQLSRITTSDPFAGLPAPEDLGRFEGDLQLYSPSVAELPTEWKIGQAIEAEAAAFAFDSRISNSEGASFDTHVGHTVFANSLGFCDSYRSSSCSLSSVACSAPAGRTKSGYAEGADRARTSCRPLADRQHLRGGERRCDLPG